MEHEAARQRTSVVVSQRLRSRTQWCLRMTLRAGRLTPAASVIVAASTFSAPQVKPASMTSLSSADSAAVYNNQPFNHRTSHLSSWCYSPWLC